MRFSPFSTVPVDANPCEGLDGRRGVLAKVVTGGVFSIGDPIRVVSPGMDYNS